ncbi:MAG: hypothetical protein RR275_04920 [Lachnospiraceae bacterium]
MSQNEKHKILVVSHCFLNEAVKLKHPDKITQAEDRVSRRSFLKKLIAEGVELIQLPCPEVIIYGTNRWEHSLSQFDTPFFRQEARKMLLPIVMQLEEYTKYPDRFELLGILGVDGSPSCGINFTYDSDWGGEINSQLPSNLQNTTLKKISKPGVFMSVLKELLLERHLAMYQYSLETYPNKTTNKSLDFLSIPGVASGQVRTVPGPPKSRFALKKESFKNDGTTSGKGLDIL